MAKLNKKVASRIVKQLARDKDLGADLRKHAPLWEHIISSLDTQSLPLHPALLHNAVQTTVRSFYDYCKENNVSDMFPSSSAFESAIKNNDPDWATLLRVIELDDALPFLPNPFSNWQIIRISGTELTQMGAFSYVVPTVPPKIHMPSTIEVGERIEKAVVTSLESSGLSYYGVYDSRHYVYLAFMVHEKAHVFCGSFTIDVDKFPWEKFGLALKKMEEKKGSITSLVFEDEAGNEVQINGWSDLLSHLDNPDLFSKINNIMEDRRITDLVLGPEGEFLRTFSRELLKKDISSQIPDKASTEEKDLVLCNAFFFSVFANDGVVIIDNSEYSYRDAVDVIVNMATNKDSVREFVTVVCSAYEEVKASLNSSTNTVSDSAGPTKDVYDAFLRLSKKLGKEIKPHQSHICGCEITKDVDEKGKRVVPIFVSSKNRGKSGDSIDGDEKLIEDYISSNAVGLGYNNPLGETYRVVLTEGGTTKLDVPISAQWKRKFALRKTFHNSKGRVTSRSAVRAHIDLKQGVLPPRIKERRERVKRNVVMTIAVDFSGSMGNYISSAMNIAGEIRARMSFDDQVFIFGFSSGQAELLLNRATIKMDKSVRISYQCDYGGTPAAEAYSELIKFLTSGSMPDFTWRQPGVNDVRLLVFIGDFMGYGHRGADEHRMKKVHEFAKSRNIFTVGISVTEDIAHAFDLTYTKASQKEIKTLLKDLFNTLSTWVNARRWV